MSVLNRVLLALAFILLATVAQSNSIDNGTMQTPGLHFGINNFTTSPAPAQCASPNAPDGHVDLSKCSNAFYVAVIF